MVFTKKTLLLCRSVRQICVYILHLRSDVWAIQTPLRKCELRCLNHVVERGGAYI